MPEGKGISPPAKNQIVYCTHLDECTDCSDAGEWIWNLRDKQSRHPKIKDVLRWGETANRQVSAGVCA